MHTSTVALWYDKSFRLNIQYVYAFGCDRMIKS